MRTKQHVSIESAEGKKFLRKVIREYASWDISVRSGDEDFTVVFRRTIKGEVGEPDEEVEVDTDAVVRNRVKPGFQKSFSDAKDVEIVRVTGFGLSYSDVALFASLLLDGSTFSIDASSGSTNSSEHGIAIYTLNARYKVGSTFAVVQVGGTSMSVKGRSVIQSSVYLDRP